MLLPAVVLAAAVLGLPAEALAGEDDKSVARAHYEAATRLYEVREYDKAANEYKAAYLAKPDAAFLFNIGQCHRKLGRKAEALDFFRQYLKKAPQDDPMRPSVEARVRTLESGTDVEAEAPNEGAARAPSETARSTADSAPGAASRAPMVLSPEVAAAAAPGPRSDVDLTARTAAAAESTPVYKTWWFWTGIGAAVAAGTVTAVLLAGSGRGGTQIPATSLGTAPVFQ